MTIRFLPGRPFLGGAWTPFRLGAALLAWWDAEEQSSFTLAGGLVSAWRDRVGGASATQGTTAAKPAWSAAGFNGRPCVTFDAVDDELLATRPASFPSGSGAGWMWALVIQDALPADTATRTILGFGGTTTATRRMLTRFVSAGANYAGARVGDGSSFGDAVGTGGTFDGRRIVVAKIGAATTTLAVDGIPGTSGGSVVPATGTTGSVSLGSSGTGGNFFNGRVNSVLVTAPLAAGDEARLLAYLAGRK